MGSPQCSMTEFSHIQPHMGHSGSVVSADEKYKVAGLGLLRGNGGADVVKPLRRLASHIPARMIDTQLMKPEQSKLVLGELPPHT